MRRSRDLTKPESEFLRMSATCRPRQNRCTGVHSAPLCLVRTREGMVGMKGLLVFTMIAAAMTAGLVLVSKAAAAPPRVETYPEQSSEIYPAGSLCSFSVRIDIAEEARVTTFFDQGGVATTVRTHVTGGSVSENLATGTQLPAAWSFTLTEDPSDQSAAVTGQRSRYADPNGGVLALAAGRQVWDSYIQTGNIVFDAGRTDLLTIADFCEALSS